ncbi:MAG: recombinase family protein [Candidatus Hydrogenedentes bacterium]|nr:recombinase family protein [Candidatus Hydrogenedentota bacterium]
MPKHIAIYLRVSSRQQDTKSQKPDLERWAEAQDEPIKWYEDTATGKNMNRPGWKQLEDAMRTGKVSAIVVWRLDRLGRTVSGLSTLFDELTERKINLVTIMDGINLSTAAGRMMANVIASVAQYETEMRGERVAAGQAVAKAKGVRWGGWTEKHKAKVSQRKADLIIKMKKDKVPIAEIARELGLSRPTIYKVLEQKQEV